MMESPPGLDDNEYRAAFQRMTLPVVVTNDSLTIVALTDGFSQLVGSPRNTLRGRSLDALVSGCRIRDELSDSKQPPDTWSGRLQFETEQDGLATAVTQVRSTNVFEFESQLLD